MHVLFIAGCKFPFGNALSMRARSLYKLLENAGHKVHVICDNDTDIKNDECKAYSYESVGIRYRYGGKFKILKRIKQYCKKNKVDCILITAKADRFNQIAAFCKKNHIRFIVENCEWFDPSSYKLGRIDPRYMKYLHMMKSEFKKADGFISISRLLDDHKKEIGVSSIRVPTILDVMNTAYSTEVHNEKCVIVYIGDPRHGKELFLPVYEALAKDEFLREHIQFNIYGADNNVVYKNIGNDPDLINKVGSAVIVHGRVPQSEIESIVREANFMLFLRPKRRSSDAGFPTKLGESLAVGTPVITNDTGDIGLYIKDGENGYMADLQQEGSVQGILNRAVEIGSTEYSEMRLCARKTAEKHFDFREYTKVVDLLLKNEL